MMKFFKKITGITLAFGVLCALFSPPSMAQSALDDIKSHLESAGITVVDYSSPEGRWGALPQEWIGHLQKEGYSNLGEVANELEDYFIGVDNLTDLRSQLAIAEAEKSHLTDSKEISKKEKDIRLLRESIDFREKEAEDAIKKIIKKGLTEERQKEGANLIFREVDFYFNYNKWGRLPIRIIGVLEKAGYENLQQMVANIGGFEVNDFSSFNALLKEVGVDAIRSALSELEDLSADDVDFILDSLNILGASGERQITEIARAVTDTLKNLIIGLAVIWIIYAGIRIIFAQGEESVITEQKKSILYVGIGLIAILLVGRGIDFLYGPAGIVRTELTQDQGFSNEVYGLVHFLKAFTGIIAILFIIISGIKMLFASGDESEITKQKTSLLWIGVGVILILINKVIVENIFIIPSQDQSDQIRTSNIISIINLIGNVLQFILGFVGLIAFGILIYGAANMIMNFGNDEMVEKSKKIIKNAVIGILVILSAYVIVATLVIFK